MLLSATAAPAEPAEAETPWVCVPSEEFGWRCGRGANAPEQSPLPEPPPPAPPPQGYVPPQGSNQLPAYLRPSSPEGGPGAAREEPARAGPVAPTDERPAQAGPVAPAPEQAAPQEEASDSRETAAPASEAPATGAKPPAENPGPRYGIQLTAGRSPESLDTFLERHELPDSDLYRRRWHDEGGAWYVLLVGSYPSVSLARRALSELPEEIRRNGAWVRRMDTLEPVDDDGADDDDSTRERH